MKRILVGADGSTGSANAIGWASQLASRNGAEVIVMTGFRPTDSEMRPGRLETLVARQDRELDAWAEAARRHGVPVRTIVERGDPRPGILAVADREHADLIVIGRVGRSAGPGLLHMGSMAEWLAHHVDRPVAIIGDSTAPTRNVLVGVDGSDGSRAAVAWIRDLGVAAADVRVVAVSMEEPLPEWTADTRENRRRDLEHRIRDDFAADLSGTDVELDVVASIGTNAAEVLVRTAQERECDLIVVGARGLGGFTGLRIGGVALRALHLSDRPIVLVPPG